MSAGRSLNVRFRTTQLWLEIKILVTDEEQSDKNI
jgi:hypothetical protein